MAVGIPPVLPEDHLRRVVAAFRHADGWTHAVSGGCFQEIVETLVAFEVAELHQLCGFMGKSNGGHSLLLAAGVRIIRAPDSEAELRGILTAAVKRLPSRLSPQPLCGNERSKLWAEYCPRLVNAGRRGILPNWQISRGRRNPPE
jgi:hypothetical protein